MERRNLLSKYRGFWTYIEDEKLRYASILRNDTVFIAFSLGYTSYQADYEAARAFRLSSRTIDERFRKTVIFVC